MNNLDRQNFINKIGPIIAREAFARGYKYPSAIIAQACKESRFGDSKIMAKAHNYFGMKCGKSWKGKAFSAKTGEEYTPGKITNITACFRAYISMEAGVKGYFDFISTPRYANLKSATSVEDFCNKIKADGWATDSTYSSSLVDYVNKYALRSFDQQKATQGSTVKPVSAPAPIQYKPADDDVARKVINGLYGNGNDRKVNLEREGYNYDEVRARVNSLLGVQAKPAAPQFKAVTDDLVRRVIQGKYGNGKTRQALLEREGYNYEEVRRRINEYLKR